MFGIFKTPTAQEIVRKKLIETERDLLAALEREEYARAITTMYRERLARLRGNLSDMGASAAADAPKPAAETRMFSGHTARRNAGPATIPNATPSAQ